MKNNTWILTALMVIAVACFFACQKESPDKALYAPDGRLVSNSIEEFSKAVAGSIEADPQDMVIQSIHYLAAPVGYIAEVNLWFKSTQMTNRVYYVSDDALAQITFDGDLKQVKTPGSTGASDRVVKETVVWCTCGSVGGAASSQCTASVTVGSQGTSGTCTANGCTTGCYTHMAIID